MLYAGLDEAPYFAKGERGIVFFLASILGLTMVISGAAWYVGRRLSLPLSNLTVSAAALGKGERKEIRVLPNDPEEIRVLAKTLNTMTDLIIAHTAELIASREKAQKALSDYLKVLKFVAHELKSPFSGALSQLMFIEDGHAGKVPEKLSPRLAAIHRYMEYGFEMAQSFNQLSRAESEGFTAHKQLLADFQEQVIRLSIDDFSAEAAHHKMKITLAGDRAALWADPDLMRVVIDNLIGNALKYGQEGTEIRITSQKIRDSLRIEVLNQGIGVPRERFSQLFTKFFRIRDPKLESRKGTGVGLYLIKKIVELHNGLVGIDGDYGKWIKFWFEIPYGNSTELPVK
jgi:signal transduction histidine kinase